MSVINIRTQEIAKRYIEKKVSVFRIKYNGKSYLVSTNCYLPIHSLKINDRILNKDDILIDSKWNNLLVIKDQSQFVHTFDKIRKSILPIGNNNNFSVGDEPDYILDEIIYLPYGMLPNYPNLMYLKLSGDVSKVKEGDPVSYSNNGCTELVATIAYTNGSHVLALPIYYLYKTLERYINNIENEIRIPNLKSLAGVSKIDRNKIVNGFIWNKSIKANIPLDVYFLLENEKSQIFEINGEIKVINFIEYKGNMIIPNHEQLVKDGELYSLTTRSFHVLASLDKKYQSSVIRIIDSIFENFNYEKEVEIPVSNIKFNVDENEDLIIIT